MNEFKKLATDSQIIKELILKKSVALFNFYDFSKYSHNIKL